MFDFFRKLFRRDPPSRPRAPITDSCPTTHGRAAAPVRNSSATGFAVNGKVESQGPGKNVLVRNKYQREDTGTHETLKIIDDSLGGDDDGGGIDPYNTGQFDRSKNWDKRFRK